jgi:hypothetical protein
VSCGQRWESENPHAIQVPSGKNATDVTARMSAQTGEVCTAYRIHSRRVRFADPDAIRGECDTADRVGMSTQSDEIGTANGIPETKGLIVGFRYNMRPIGGKCNGINSFGMSPQIDKMCTAERIPDPKGFGMGSGHDTGAMGECDRIDPVGMPFPSVHGFQFSSGTSWTVIDWSSNSPKMRRIAVFFGVKRCADR